MAKKKVYVTRPGDQWDIIAKRVYGKEIYADWLMENNFEHLDTYEFDAGVELNIPDLPEVKETTLPVWRSSD